MQAVDKSEKLRALFMSGRSLNYQKNEIILRANDTPRGVYGIESGLVKIYSLTKEGTEHVHHFFGPGDFFPVIWTFRDTDRHMYFETLAPTKVWLVPQKTFIQFISDHQDAMFELLQELIERYHLYTGRIDNLLYSDARERCAYRLLSLASRFGVKTDAGVMINAVFTHEDLAHSINMTRETFGRSFGRLQKRSIIGYDAYRHLIIKDLSVLIAIIGREEAEAMWPELVKFIK